jgi:2,4-dienoyl-CoA reductase-like NADH-dependent reductase (Old Yellow Enzyme family)
MKLFETVKIRSVEVNNRIVLPPAGTLLTSEDGAVTQRMIDYYARLAKGGAGMIEVEGAAPDHVIPSYLG